MGVAMHRWRLVSFVIVATSVFLVACSSASHLASPIFIVVMTDLRITSGPSSSS
jgi:hypothetical protein